MKTLRAAFAAILVSACATTANYERTLNSWIGQSESALVAAWGPPSGVYVAPDGSRILTFNDARSLNVPGSAPSYRITTAGNAVYATPYGGRSAINMDLYCQTHMTVRNGIVASWSWEGNDCYQ